MEIPGSAQLAIYTAYISLTVYIAFWGVICHLPPITRTRKQLLIVPHTSPFFRLCKYYCANKIIQTIHWARTKKYALAAGSNYGTSIHHGEIYFIWNIFFNSHCKGQEVFCPENMADTCHLGLPKATFPTSLRSPNPPRDAGWGFFPVHAPASRHGSSQQKHTKKTGSLIRLWWKVIPFLPTSAKLAWRDPFSSWNSRKTGRERVSLRMIWYPLAVCCNRHTPKSMLSNQPCCPCHFPPKFLNTYHYLRPLLQRVPNKEVLQGASQESITIQIGTPSNVPRESLQTCLSEPYASTSIFSAIQMKSPDQRYFISQQESKTSSTI